MKVIVRPRQMGKTRKLIQISEQTGAIIIVPDHRFVKNVQGLALKLGYVIPKPMTFGELKEKQVKPELGVLIDNADYIIRSMIGSVVIKGIALDGFANEDDYDERRDYENREEFKNLTYEDFCTLKEKAWMYDDLNK